VKRQAFFTFIAAVVLVTFDSWAQEPSASQTVRVLPPKAGPITQNAFGRLAAPWRLDSAKMERQQVFATVCDDTKLCFSFSMSDPQYCEGGQKAGPWCLQFSQPNPPAQLVQALIQAFEPDLSEDFWEDKPMGTEFGTREEAPRQAIQLTPDKVLEMIDGDLPKGWTLSVRSPHPDARNVALASIVATGPEGSLNLELLEPYTGDWAVCSINYCIDVHEGGADSVSPATVSTILQALGHRLLQTDSSAPFSQQYATHWRVLLVIVLAVTILLSIIALVGQIPLTHLVSLTALFCLGLGLRLFYSPHAFLHEFGYVTNQLLSINGGALNSYGEAPFVLAWVFNLLFHNQATAFFVASALMAALTIPLVGLLDWLLFDRWDKALFSAFLLALLPLHLRFSASGVASIALTLFSVWGLAMVLLYAKSRSLSALFTGTLAVFLATQSRPEFIIWPVIVLLFVILNGHYKACLKPGFFAAAALLVLLLAVRFVMFPIAQDAPAPEAYLSFKRIVLFDPDVTPWVFLMFALVGLVWSFSKRFKQTALLVLLIVGMAFFYMYFFDNETYTLRTQVALAPFFAMIAGGFAGAVGDFLSKPRWLNYLLLAVASLFVVVSTAQLTNWIKENPLVNQEYSFVHQALPKLPDGLNVALYAPELGPHAFPRMLFSDMGKLIRLVPVERDLKVGKDIKFKRGTTMLYKGLYCYADKGKEREQCQLLLRNCELKPILTGSLVGRPSLAGVKPNSKPNQDFSTYEVGFYEVISCGSR